MDVVLGFSIAPASVQMVLLQGENADGVTVDEKDFVITAPDDSPTVTASDQVIAAILGTCETAAVAGMELSAVGVSYTDQLEAAALSDLLAGNKLEKVMLVPAFLAAVVLTQSVGGAMDYERTALMFVEPDTATLTVVETSDGSVTDVHKEHLDSASGHIATAALREMVAELGDLPARPNGLFLVGSGVDIAPIKRHLEEATSLAVSTPEDPETALARGAALASADAPLFASTTAALAYAREPGTGSLAASVSPEYLRLADAELGGNDLAYSATADDEACAPTVVIDASGESEPARRRVLLVGSAVAVGGISAALALELALGLGLRATVGLLPAPVQSFIAPAQQALMPALGPVAATKAVAPKPLSSPAGASAPAAPVPAAPVHAAPVPVPVVVPPPAPAPVPAVHLPVPPASPPAAQAPRQASPPAVHVPPGGAPSENPGGSGPVVGLGPIHGNPGVGGPHGGGPVDNPGPHHGTPGGPPPVGRPDGVGGPPAGHVPPSGGEPPGAGGPPGAGEHQGDTGPVGGGETHVDTPPAGGGETHVDTPPAGGSETHVDTAPVGGGESGRR